MAIIGGWGAPKGNQFAKGHGRKSAFEERQDAEWLANKWSVDTDKQALEARIASGMYSIRDMYLYKCLAGDTKMLTHAGDRMLMMPKNIEADESLSNMAYIIRRGVEAVESDKK